MQETYRGVTIYYECPTMRSSVTAEIKAHFTHGDDTYLFRASSLIEVQIEAKNHIDLLLKTGV